jgi:hypothetical protein
MKPPNFNTVTAISDIKNIPEIIPNKEIEPVNIKVADLPEIDIEPMAEQLEADNLNLNQLQQPDNKLPEIDVKTATPKLKIVKLEATDDTGFARGTYMLHINVDPNSEVHLVKLFIDGILRDMKSNQSFIKYWNTREYTNTLHTIEVVAIKNNQIISKDILRIQVDN